MNFREEDIQRYCEENNVRIHPTHALTTKVRGFCYYDGEEYHVLINLKFDFFNQRRTTIHELIHILNDHFCCEEKDRAKCEQEVESIIRKMKTFDVEYALDII